VAEHLVTHVTVTDLQRGLNYRFRYRAQNLIGWSAYSPIVSILAARLPEPPTELQVLSSTATSITFRMGACLENQGAAIEFYTLYRSEGTSLVQVYQGEKLNSYTVEGLTTGEYYHFKATASNIIGESDFSHETSFYAAAVPSQPVSLIKGASSDRNQIQIQWPVHLDEDIPVTGYVLEADLDGFGVFEEIWDGRGRPEFNEYLLSEQVTTGRFYNFRHKVLNLNGESPYSDTLKVWTCEMPTAPTQPSWITSSETSIHL